MKFAILRNICGNVIYTRRAIIFLLTNSTTNNRYAQITNAVYTVNYN